MHSYINENIPNLWRTDIAPRDDGKVLISTIGGNFGGTLVDKKLTANRLLHKQTDKS